MTNQNLVNRITELAGNITATRLSISPNLIIDLQLEQELTRLTDMLKPQIKQGLIAQNQSDALLALISGLHLWNGSLDNSHTISQDLENKTGSYLHGMLHRMEPDYPNAKYWFRMAGKHPDGDLLHKAALELSGDSVNGYDELYMKFNRINTWSPELMTDLVATVAFPDYGNELEVQLLEKIQAKELQLLIAKILQGSFFKPDWTS